MPREFTVPLIYQSRKVKEVKKERQDKDPKKKDFSPSVFSEGRFTFKIARHFGFCFGVQNAIEIAYKALEENNGKRVFLLSEMIHNPTVNEDLLSRGAKFLMNTRGEAIFDFNKLSPEDVVIVPAFGTTIEIQQKLEEIGINPYKYDSTCPFVTKVWKRSQSLGDDGYSVIIHGKSLHEETRATFSHSNKKSNTLIIANKDDARFICRFLDGSVTKEEFKKRFEGRTSQGFDPELHLRRVGVVNQTTMLATETKDIAKIIKEGIQKKYGTENISYHFADTRDTLCYATVENQTSTMELVSSGADIGLIVGGYNSSNTTHLAELMQEHFPTYFVKNEDCLKSSNSIEHYDIDAKETKRTNNWLPRGNLTVAITSGASCPDSVVERVIDKICTLQ